MDFVNWLLTVKQNWRRIAPEDKELIERLLPFILDNMEHSHAQFFQDSWAMYAHKNDFYPFFVEFGAGDGILNSNTRILQNKYGWEGILAEANPVWHDQLVKRASTEVDVCTKCVYTESDKKLTFKSTLDPELGTISGYESTDEHASRRENATEFEVETISLYDMLSLYKAPMNISYMSIDTEGSEYDILSAFFKTNNNEYTVNSFSIEHNYIQETREKIRVMMEEQGYQRKFEAISFCDDFYVRK